MTIDSAFQKVVEVQRLLSEPRNRRIVGARIRLLRAERDIGQNELAQRVNFHNSKMCKLESGAQPLTPEDANGINLNEDNMKTIGDRIEQLLRERGRARYEGAPPYTQVELVEMLTGKRPAPNGKYYSVSTNKSTVSRVLTDKQELPYDVLFAICDMFDTDTEWILRGNVLEAVLSEALVVSLDQLLSLPSGEPDHVAAK